MNWLSTGKKNAPRILCVGAPPFGLRTFSPLAQALAQDYRIEAALDAFARCPEALVNRAKKDPEQPCLLLLQGMASAALLPHAACWADAFAGLIIIGGPGPTADFADSECAAWLRRQQTVLMQLDAADRFELLLRHLGEGIRPLEQRLRDVLREEAETVEIETLVALAEGAIGTISCASLSGLPMLYVRGDRDRTATEAPQAANLDLRTAVLPGVGHFPTLDATDMTATLLHAFATMPAGPAAG